MNWMRKCKGSISIFLCLILLPMVTYSSMIIDASRLQSARVAVASAGDLAMNAALSEYETVLEDMYGMFAVAKSDDELKEALQSYFTQTIESKISGGATKEDLYAQNISGAIVDMIFQDDENVDFNNLIQMQIAENGFTYKGVTGATLANPAVMKRQIIDYMKYKGPISLVSTLFSKLSFLKDSSKQTEVLEKKVEYTEKLSELKDPCEKAYYNIVGKDNEDGSHANGYNDYATLFKNQLNAESIDVSLSKTEKMYNLMSQCIILYKNRVFESTLNFEKLCNEAQNEGYINSYSDIDTSNISEETANDLAIKLDTIQDRISEIVNIYNDDYIGAFESDCDNIIINESSDPNNTLNSTFTAEIEEKPERPFSYANFKGGGKWRTQLNLSSNFTRNYNSGNFEIESLKTTDDDMLAKLRTRYNTQKYVNDNKIWLINFVARYYNFMKLRDMYNEIFTEFEKKFKEEAEIKIKEDNPDEDYDEDTMSVLVEDEMKDGSKDYLQRHYNNLKINSVSEILEKYKLSFEGFLGELCESTIYNDFAEYYANKAYSASCQYYQILLNIDNSLNAVVLALNNVIKCAENVESAKVNWGESVANVESESTKASLKSDHDTTTKAFEIAEVQNLLKVVEGLKVKSENLVKQMESIKYIDVQIFKSIKILEKSMMTPIELKDFESNSVYDKYKITGDASQIISFASELQFDRSAIKQADFTEFKLIDGEVDEEKFFKTLESICNPKGKKNLSDDNQKQIDVIENNTNLSDGKPSSNEAPKGFEKTESEQKQEINLIKADIGSIWDEINNYCNDNKITMEQNKEESYKKATNGHSNISSGDYNISGVGIPDSEEDAKGKDPSAPLKQAKGLLEQIGNIATTIRDTAYLEEYFTEMFTCQTDAIKEAGELQMLNGFTNGKNVEKALNSNTEWYGKEVEYIIWGGNDLNSNLSKNEALIYTIRFALNAIYAFTAPDIQSFALEVATAIAGWTVIGVPIVQACITVAIALAESAYDLYLLKDGQDVAIYKNTSTFVCSPVGALKEVATQTTRNVINEVANKAKNTLDSKLDDISEKFDSSIDSVEHTVGEAMDDIDNYLKDYVKEQSLTIQATIRNQFVSPIVQKITPIMTRLNEGAGNLNKLVTDAVEEAFSVIESNLTIMNKGIAKDVLKEFLESSMIEKYKSDLISTLTQYFEKIDDVTNIDLTAEIDKNIKVWIGSMEATIDSKLDEVKEEIKNNISGMKDEAAENIKNIVHDQINKASDKINGTIDSIAESATEKVTSTIDKYVTEGKGVDKAASGGVTLNYKEYCKIFVLLKIPFDEENMLKRAGALIQLNVQNAVHNANSKFKMVNANTLVSINAKVQLGTLFPWPVKDEQNVAGGESNVALDFSHLGTNVVEIEYNGMNGY